MKIGLDTNFLSYADGFDDVLRRDKANRVLLGLAASEIVIPIQVIAEFYNLLIKKHGLLDGDAERHVFVWADLYSTIDTSYQVLSEASELRRKHKLQVFDSIILAACSLAGCSMLMTEDGHHGFQWQGCTIVDPFREPVHPLLAEALARYGSEPHH